MTDRPRTYPLTGDPGSVALEAARAASVADPLRDSLQEILDWADSHAATPHSVTVTVDALRQIMERLR